MTDAKITEHKQQPTALISVYDKHNIVNFAEQLIELGFNIVSSGGTHKVLSEAGLTVTEVNEVTDFPEMMGGRLKTLHPKIHGGILARRGKDEALLQAHNIPQIDLVVVNLYPFADTISTPECTIEQAIEQIDIGGPTLLRAAAKNHRSVTVLTDPQDYSAFIEASADPEKLHKFRQAMALKTFQHTAYYDSIISQYLFDQYQSQDVFPSFFLPGLTRQTHLRYGENPHQAAALYRETFPAQPNLIDAHQHQGKPLSYNNLADADAALDIVKGFTQPACVIVKHANPCGVATGEDSLTAYNKALATDPTSAFGGIIAFNRPIDESLARTILEKQFVEVILAPQCSEQALAVLSTKSNVRVLALPQWSTAQADSQEQASWSCKRIAGGLLVQTQDTIENNTQSWKIVTKTHPTPEQNADLAFAWQVVRAVKSNAIVMAKNGQTLGIGAGQMSRVFSAQIAKEKAAEAGLELQGCALASDAFFPFADSISIAVEAGVKAIIQPGGSVRDAEVIAAADEAGIVMIFTGKRHFNH